MLVLLNKDFTPLPNVSADNLNINVVSDVPRRCQN